MASKRKVFKELPAAVEPIGFKRARVFVVVTPNGEWYAQGSSWEQGSPIPSPDFFGRMLATEQHFSLADIYIPIPPNARRTAKPATTRRASGGTRPGASGGRR